MRIANPLSRQHIIDTAAALFAEHRFHEVRMDDIAARSGVSKGALYRHFKDKDDLYMELMFRGIDGLFDDVKARISGPKSPEDKLRGFVEEVVRFFSATPCYLELIQRAEQMSSEQATRLRERRAGFVNALTGVVRELDDTGRWAAGDAEIFALALMGMTREILRGQAPVPGDIAQRIVQLFLNGVRKS